MQERSPKQPPQSPRPGEPPFEEPGKPGEGFPGKPGETSERRKMPARDENVNESPKAPRRRETKR